MEGSPDMKCPAIVSLLCCLALGCSETEEPATAAAPEPETAAPPEATKIPREPEPEGPEAEAAITALAGLVEAKFHESA